MEFFLGRLDLGLFIFFCSSLLRFVARSPVFCAKVSCPARAVGFLLPLFADKRRCCGRCTCSQPFLGWLSLKATMSQLYKINLMEGMLCFNGGLVNYWNTPWFCWGGTESREPWNTEVLTQTWSSPPGMGIYFGTWWNETRSVFLSAVCSWSKAKSLLSVVLFLVGLWHFFPFLPGLAIIFPCCMESL